MIRFPLLLALVAVLAGCGGGREHGTATLWVTRDRGAHVVYAGNIPAGLTAIQVLDRKLDITTRYGGRFVQSINGVHGSLTKHQDWFYFVNGVEGDRSGAEIKVRPGDTVWWDFRAWTGKAMSVPAVLGAFPEPFLHGFGWVKPGAAVYASAGDESLAKQIARLVGGKVGTDPSPEALSKGNSIVLSAAPALLAFMNVSREAHRVSLFLSERAARRLVANPHAFRFKYEVRAP